MNALRQQFKDFWLQALKEKNFNNVTKFIATGKDESECADNCFKGITAVEMDQKRFCLQFEEKHYAFNYDQFPLSKNYFQHIQELRVLHQPEDLSICDNFFGHDIKKILIWDKPLPEKYCDIQKQRNSLEEVYIYSKNGLNYLSIISSSCRKLEVQFFKMENIQNIVNNVASYPSIEHLIIHEAYFAKDFDPEIVKQLCVFISKAFPNLKQLDMDADYENRHGFKKMEAINLDEKMFEALSPSIKGSIKFETNKWDEIFEGCAEMAKDTHNITTGRNKQIQTKAEIHDGLIFESSLIFSSEYGMCWHPFFGYKNPPLGPFCFQHFCYNRCSTIKSSCSWLTD